MNDLISLRRLTWEEGTSFFDELALIQKADRNATHRRLRVFDTFDWRLFGRGQTLTVERVDGTYRWRWTTIKGVLLRQYQSRKRPDFAENLPRGPLRTSLEKLTDIRRILPRVQLEIATQELCFLDRYRKTTLRLELSKARSTGIALSGKRLPESKELETVLRIQGLKGFERDYFKILERLERRSLVQPSPSLVEQALRLNEPPAGEYRSKPFVAMEAKDPAWKVIADLLLAQLKVTDDNVEGTIRDLDPEFLHDLRVSVRRSRSVLGQMNGVFDLGAIAPFRDGLKRIGGHTGPLRDLDVFKIDYPKLVGELDEQHQSSIEPLKVFLEERHLEEQKRLASVLRSTQFKEFILRWSAFLEEPVSGPVGEEQIKALVQNRTWRRWIRMKKRGRQIVDNSPDDDLHEVRLDAKKLRYQLELFGQLFPQTPLIRLVKGLKQLQEVLGSFNDRCVQVECLSRYSEEMVARGEVPVATFLAMGRLQSILDDQRRFFKHQFKTEFDKFLEYESVLAKLFRKG